MKKTYLQKIALGLAFLSTLSVGGMISGCSHTHQFNKKSEDAKYLKAEATCQSAAQYYYSCECGEVGEQTFTVGKVASHDFSAEIAEEKYLQKAGNCQEPHVYFKSCVTCGAKTYKTFEVSAEGQHSYTQEVAEGQYLKEEATFTTSAVYYKSCVCGLQGTDTFYYGNPLHIYTEEEKVGFKPTSLTVTLYDSANSVYGFTYNTQKEPLRPVIQVSEGTTFSADNCVEYPATVEAQTSYDDSDARFTYYIVKAEVDLEPSKTYTYRAFDKYVDTGTDAVVFETKDTASTSFTFSHVSDSQNGPEEFTKVLENVVSTNDFILHTGDVVENSKHESEWTTMLDGNFSYISKLPMMAISGNHETTYLHGEYETYKHFHNAMPEQASTQKGYYYSFTYGNAKFIMINTNKDGGSGILSDAQLAWLKDELQNNTADWTIVAMHYPMFSAGRYGSLPELKSTSLAIRRQLHGIFLQYGVDVVLQGHDHVVSRTKAIGENNVALTETWQTIDGVQYSVDPQGVIYTMTGTSGIQTRGPVSEAENIYHFKLTSNKSSWTEYSINGNQMTVTVKYASADGVKQYAQWGITKSV